MITESANDQRSQTILLVEDSDDDYEATMRAFKKANLHNPVHWCNSGQAALDFFRELNHDSPRPGVILLDLNMPGLDGRKTLKLLKENSRTMYIPVIILTTSDDERDVEECYRSGANTYVKKPITFDGLIEAIKRLGEYWFEIAILPKGVNHE